MSWEGVTTEDNFLDLKPIDIEKDGKPKIAKQVQCLKAKLQGLELKYAQPSSSIAATPITPAFTLAATNAVIDAVKSIGIGTIVANTLYIEIITKIGAIPTKLKMPVIKM